MHIAYIELRLSFLTSRVKLAFNKLSKSFIKTSILYNFDLNYHIFIKTIVFGYAIGGIPNQLTLNTLGQCHLVTFFSKKMIIAETQYKTHNNKLLAIVNVFKTCYHFIKSCKYEFLIITNHNNLCYFISIKGLSSRQVC